MNRKDLLTILKRAAPALSTRDLIPAFSCFFFDDGTVTGFYSWPDPTAEDIANLQVRLQVTANGAADSAAVEWDSAVVEVYGQAEAVGPGVGEVSDVRGGEAPLTVLAEPAGSRLDWDPETGASVYRVYRAALPVSTASWPSRWRRRAVNGNCASAVLTISEARSRSWSRYARAASA